MSTDHDRRPAKLQAYEIWRLMDRVAVPSSRCIPAAVKRAVSDRDGNQCTYMDARGSRRNERDELEFHHHQPFGRRGFSPATP